MDNNYITIISPPHIQVEHFESGLKFIILVIGFIGTIWFGTGHYAEKEI